MYLKTPVAVLRRRLAQRRSRFDANAAFPITEATLQRFLSGFEEPIGEGEIVIEQRQTGSFRRKPGKRPEILNSEHTGPYRQRPWTGKCETGDTAMYGSCPECVWHQNLTVRIPRDG